MKRTFIYILSTVAIAVLFVGLVSAVLKTAHVSQSSGATVQGMTSRRVWAIATDLLAIFGLVIGGLGLRRSSGYTSSKLKIRSTVAIAAGLIAMVSGGLNLALATGGPGSGNGVIGGAAAVVLGLFATVLGAIAFNRYQKISRLSGDKNQTRNINMSKLSVISFVIFWLLSSMVIQKTPSTGKEIFIQKCSPCHGADGTKHLFGAKDLQKSIIPDTAIVNIISNGKRIMPSFKSKFTKDEILQITEYVKTLRKS